MGWSIRRYATGSPVWLGNSRTRFDVASRRNGVPDSRGRPAETEDERRFFEKEMRGVRPLPPGPRRAVPDGDDVPEPARSRPRSPDQIPPLRMAIEGDVVSGAAFGVNRDLLRDLAAGRIPPEAELDLHHASADSAVHRARRFIEQSVALGRRCVLLIHGRGQHPGPCGPVLRPVLVEALGQGPSARHLLALSTAPPRYGGSGALLVLLRRNQKANQK
mgnify:CR=1 FL=1